MDLFEFSDKICEELKSLHILASQINFKERNIHVYLEHQMVQYYIPQRSL